MANGSRGVGVYFYESGTNQETHHINAAVPVRLLKQKVFSLFKRDNYGHLEVSVDGFCRDEFTLYGKDITEHTAGITTDEFLMWVIDVKSLLNGGT